MGGKIVTGLWVATLSAVCAGKVYDNERARGWSVSSEGGFSTF